MADKVYIPFPAKGISEQFGYSFQEELTSRDMRNMRTRDPRTGRLRGAQRSGLEMHKDVDDQCNGNAKIKEIAQVVEALGNASYTTISTAGEQWNDGLNTVTGSQQTNVDGNILKTTLTDEGQLVVLFDNLKVQVWNSDGVLLQILEVPSPGGQTVTLKTLAVDYKRSVYVSGYVDNVGVVLFYWDYDDTVTPPAWGAMQAILPPAPVGNSTTIQCLSIDFSLENGLPYMYMLACYRDMPGGEVFDATPSVNGRRISVYRYGNYEDSNQNWDATRICDRFIPSQPYVGITGGNVTPYNASRGMQAVQQWGYMEGTILHAPGGPETNCVISVLCVDPSNGHRLEWAWTASLREAALTSDFATSDAGILSTWTQSRSGRLVMTDDGTAPSVAALNSSVYTPGDYGNGTGMGLAYTGLTENGDPGFAMYGEALNKFEEIFTVTTKPVAGDKITIIGPTLNDPSTLGTHIVEWVSGTSPNAYYWSHAITTGTNTVTTSIYLGEFSAMSTDAWKWAHILIAAQTDARNYGIAGGTLRGDSSGNEFDDYGPNCHLQEVAHTTGRIGITHPDLYTSLTSASYWQITEVSDWTNATGGALNFFTNGTGYTLRRVILQLGVEAYTAPDYYEINFDETFRRPFANGAADNGYRQLGMKADSLGDLHVPWLRGSNNADWNNHELLVVSNFYPVNTTITGFEADTGVGPMTHCEPEPVRPDSHAELPHAEFCLIAGPRDTADDDAHMWMLKLSTEDVAVAPVRNLHTIAVAGNKIRKITDAGWQDPENNTLVDADSFYVQAAVGFEEIFVADGKKYWVYDPKEGNAYGSVSQLRGDTLAPIPKYCRLIETWRDRVVIARDPVDPGRWHMSAIGNPRDWDMFPLTPTLSGAASSTNTEAGRVPDIINSVVPWTDDLILFGGDRTIWQLNGDPNYPNSVFDLISDETGMAFGRPYCKDPEGGLWFMGNGTGFFYMAPGSRPVRISLGKVEEQLRSVDLSTHYFRCAWNAQDEGVHIFQMPFGAGGTIVDHWFYEMPAQAWHKDRFGVASDLIQPTAVCRSNGDQPGDRALLVGGEDGRLRQFASVTSSVQKNDQKTLTTSAAIDSYCTIGPLTNSPIEGAQMITEFGAVLSGTQQGCNFAWYASDDPEALGEAVARGSLLPGRNDAKLVRVSGEHLYLQLRNASKGESWAYEGGYATRSYGGALRR